MAAYVILVRKKTKDREELAEYARRAKAIAKRDYEILALYTRLEVIEGDDVESVGILKFESFEKAQDWYNNPVYQDAASHRLNGGDYHTFIVDGGRGST